MKQFHGLTSALLISIGLVACGGSSSSSNNANSTSSSAATSSAASSSVSSSASSSSSATTLTGYAAHTYGVMAGATITVCDSTGTKLTATTNSNGVYSVDISSLTAPLLVAAQDGAFTTTNPTGYTASPTIIPSTITAQPLNGVAAYAALVATVTAKTSNTANVNQISDKVASDIATSKLGLAGSAQLINACKPTSVVTQSVIDAATTSIRTLIASALTANGLSSSYDPVSTSMNNNGSADSKTLNLLASIYHARSGFGSSTNLELRSTTLYDRNVQEISSDNVSLDATLPAWSSYSRRIFIVGDSTVSNYPKSTLPRKGWGMVFDTLLNSTTTKVVNAAQSGRSSRSFIHEGWFKLVENNIKSGDYLLIQWGHNDEKCEFPTAAASAGDLIYRCTYPDTIAKTTAAGYSTDMSFRASLEKYIAMAKAKGAIPVLVTPMTRINQDKTVTTYGEGTFPITATTHTTATSSKTMAVKGDYSQTIRDTGTANSVPVIDLDASSIAFANSVAKGTAASDGTYTYATGGWRDYWLGVQDFVTFPYYKTLFGTDGVTALVYSSQTTGNWLNADRTHFQEKGALKMASLVVTGIKADTSGTLTGLVSLLK